MKKEIEYVKRSKHRTMAMKSLMEDIKTPSEITRDTGKALANASAPLMQLRERGLVECINPEAAKGRLYRLTEKGEKVAEKL